MLAQHTFSTRISCHTWQAFVFKEKAIILSGPSGSGKSESLNILKDNFEIISDDIVAISSVNNKLVCHPGLPFMCVKNGLKKMPLNDKRQRSFKPINLDQMATKNYEIDHILFLEWGNFNTLGKISSVNGFKNLLANSFRPLPTMSDGVSEKVFLKNLASIVSSSSQFIFKRMRGDITRSTDFLKITLEEIK